MRVLVIVIAGLAPFTVPAAPGVPTRLNWWAETAIGVRRASNLVGADE